MLVKSLQLVKQLAHYGRDILTKENIETILYLVHHPAQSVKDEIADIVLAKYEMEKDDDSLIEFMPMQKVKATEADVQANFSNASEKSKAQLREILVIAGLIKTKVEVRGIIGSREEADQDFLDEEIFALEKAKLIYRLWGKKISVLYDLESI